MEQLKLFEVKESPFLLHPQVNDDIKLIKSLDINNIYHRDLIIKFLKAQITNNADTKKR